MYINPQTNIRILSNVPLDTTYDHTIYFDSSSAQYNYFISLQKYNLTNYTYQRVKRGVARVGIKADNLYDCNYMMFQNSAYGNKWFYAFITSVEYINNECSEISFELDVMQTWFFEHEPDYCFVEREHSVTDELWENLIPENLELGDYTITKKDTFDMAPFDVCILSSKTSSGAKPTGKAINNVYTPLNVIAGIPSTDALSLNNALSWFIEQGQEDAIASIYMYPSFLGDASTTTPQVINKFIRPNLTSIDGYTPKNKKLFSYPYSMLVVSNNSGQTAEYRWEQWNNEENGATFKIEGVFVSTPCVICIPTNYRGISEDVDSSLTYNNFPQIPWVGDTYKRWIAQNKNTIATGLISTAIGGALTVAGLASGNPLAALLSVGHSSNALGSSVNNVMARTVDAKNTPPQVHGQIQCDSLNAGTGRCEFTFLHTCIRAQFARSIDEYFSMFGYATRRVKKPNRNSRPHWNYVKTIGATVTGSVPADDMQKICSIYDNGITFWKKGSEVGQYNLDNTV